MDRSFIVDIVNSGVTNSMSGLSFAINRSAS